MLAHQSRARHLLFGGAVGPGKSRFLVQHIAKRMLDWPGIPIVLGRYNLKDLQRTTEVEWRRHIDNRLWDPKFGGRYDSQTNSYRFANGSTLYMTQLKDWESWMSAELGMIVYEEISEVPEIVYQNLDTRLRWTTGEGVCEREECAALANAREHSRHPLYQNVAASNPTPRWPKQRWYDRWANGTLPKSHEFIQALTEDNPFLPPDYESALMEGNNATWVRRMLKGDWTAFEGATFWNFNRPTHIWTDDRPFMGLIEEVYGGIDWGGTTTYAHRTAATLTARLRNGDFLTFWEYSKQGPASVDLIQTLQRMSRLFNVRQWFAGGEQGRAIELLADPEHTTAPLPIKAAPMEKGVRKTRANLLFNLFEPIGKDGAPKLMIHESCTHTITGIETYHEVPESEVATGHGPIPDEPSRRDDDEVDALGMNLDGMNRLRPVVSNQAIEVVLPHNRNQRGVSSIMAARRDMKTERLRQFLEDSGGRGF